MSDEASSKFSPNERGGGILDKVRVGRRVLFARCWLARLGHGDTPRGSVGAMAPSALGRSAAGHRLSYSAAWPLAGHEEGAGGDRNEQAVPIRLLGGGDGRPSRDAGRLFFNAFSDEGSPSLNPKHTSVCRSPGRVNMPIFSHRMVHSGGWMESKTESVTHSPLKKSSQVHPAHSHIDWPCVPRCYLASTRSPLRMSYRSVGMEMVDQWRHRSVGMRWWIL